MKIKANIYKSDKPTPNGRIYPKEELLKAIDKFNADTQIVTFEDYPPKNLDDENEVNGIGTVKLEYTEDDIVMAKIDILDSPQGIVFQEIIMAGAQDNMVALPVGAGQITDDGVISDFKILSVICAPADGVTLHKDHEKSSLYAIEEIRSSADLFAGIKESMFIVEIDE